MSHVKMIPVKVSVVCSGDAWPKGTPGVAEPAPVMPMLRDNAKRDLLRWLELHSVLKDHDDLYDAVAMAVELSEMTHEQAKAIDKPAKKRKGKGA